MVNKVQNSKIKMQNDKAKVKNKEPKEVKSDELLKIEKKNEELEAQVKRVLADYQNLEKRVREERHHWIQTANKELLLRLLPVLDTLNLAQKHSKDQSLIVSIQQFWDVLKGEGVTKIETLGREFDPKTMECVVTEDREEGKVLEELRIGYMLRDMVLRPAQVKVGSAKQNQEVRR
ncbi:MAG: nucleotide exchange factor GrpE [Candidatus Levybacteria bacterium]|nr:nucleotide exchange factor GrpE [Candidatus Levybacteria bacterium]